GPSVGAGAAALSFAIHIRAGTTFAKIRAASGASRWANACGFARKSLGTNVGQCLSTTWLAGKQQRLRSERTAASKESRSARHGEVRREFLQVAGIRSPARNFLGAVAVRKAGRS